MPIDYSLYPKDWKALSKRIRVERAKGRCECKGCCGIRHYDQSEHGVVDRRCEAQFGGFKVWDKATGEYRLFENEERLISFLTLYDENDYKVVKIVLTVAHLCKCRPKCGNEEHLLALCAACHLRLDMPIHKANAAKTRRKKKYKGQEQLVFDGKKAFD